MYGTRLKMKGVREYSRFEGTPEKSRPRSATLPQIMHTLTLPSGEVGAYCAKDKSVDGKNSSAAVAEAIHELTR